MTAQSHTLRCTFSLPAELALEIAETARALNVSQSALVAQVLAGPLGRLAMYLSVANPLPSDRALRRRGESREVIEKLISDAIASSLVIAPDLLDDADGERKRS